MTPKSDPGDTCRQKGAIEGPEPKLVGRSSDGWQQLAMWNTFLDPSNDHQGWLPYKQCRTLAWKRGVANGLKVSRSEAFRAVQLILLRAGKQLYEYHRKGPWMTMLVEAIERLLSVDGNQLDDDYGGYNGEPREGVLSENMANAGIGHRGCYDEIRNDCVPPSVITHIRNWKAETSKFSVHPSTELSCKALLRDGLLHAPSNDQDSNCYAFIKPKNSQKCAFIVDMSNVIEECMIKPRRSPLLTVSEIFAKTEEMRRQGPVFGTTIDLTNFY